MKRTYVFYLGFVVMALAGAAAFIGLAGGSDLGLFSTGEVLGYGLAALLLSCVGVWGSRLCGEGLRRRARKAPLRLVKNHGGEPGRAA